LLIDFPSSINNQQLPINNLSFLNLICHLKFH